MAPPSRSASSPPSAVRTARTVFVVTILVASGCFAFKYGLDFDARTTWVWLAVCIPVLALAHFVAWILVPKIAAESAPAARVRMFVAAVIPLAAVAVTGLVRIAGDWDDTHLVLLPTIPSMFAVAWVANSAEQRESASA